MRAIHKQRARVAEVNVLSRAVAYRPKDGRLLPVFYCQFA